MSLTPTLKEKPASETSVGAVKMSLLLPGAGTTMLGIVEYPAPPGVHGEPPKAPPPLGAGTLTVGK